MSKSIRRFLRNVTLSKPATRFYDRFQKNRTLGQRGEREAERFFLRSGCVIIERGYHDKFGEIDLIVVDDETVVFVEVKTRRSDFAGLPSDAVDENKQAKITRTAQGFLKWHRLTECRVRFDVVAILWPESDGEFELKHYESAFEAAGEFQLF